MVGGLAAGASFSAVTGISAATGTPDITTESGSTATAPAVGMGGPHGHKGDPDGPGRKGGRGNGGTITGISGSTLTLRTENGTETVDPSSSTTYSKEMQMISFADLHVNDVVHVAATSPTASTATTPPAPGTGTVSATAVTVVEPSFAGRVASVSNGAYGLVGRDGRLLTVKTTGSTRYENGTSQAAASAITVGSHVMAQGTQNDLTDLTADVITLRPTPGSPPAGAPTPPAASSSAPGAGS